MEESNFTTQAQIQNKAATPGNDLKRQTTCKPQNPSKMRKLDAQFNEAIDVIKSVSNKIGRNKPAAQTTKSTDDVFGEYVASKLRGYSDYTKNFVQHKINNILFDADMGLYNQPETTLPLTISLPQQSNSTTTYSSSHNSPSLLLSNEEGTQFTILTVGNDTTQL